MVTLKDIEYAIAKQDFDEWLRYVKVLEPYPGRGEISFEPWPHLLRIAEALRLDPLLVWLKSRQLGCSWLVAAFTLWKTLYNPGVHILEFAQNEPKAAELITKQKYIYSRLPEGLKIPIKSMENQLEMVFPTTESWIRAYPSTKDASRGLTGTIAWFDECDFHEYFDVAYSTTKPVIDDVGGQIILTSTANPEKAIEGSTFQSIYTNAPDNGFRRIFYGWKARTERTEAWYTKVRKESIDLFAFEKEHAATDIQALSAPSNILFFNRLVLEEMLNDCQDPISTTDHINIYKPFSLGKRYVAATDTSHGVGGDDAVTVVVDLATGFVVADIKCNALTPESLADESVQLLKMYRDPLWAIEDNDWGAVTIRKAVELGYKNFYYYKKDCIGWHTGHNNRFFLWGELAEAVTDRGITIPNESGLKQFFTVIRNPKKQGRIEAQQGKHDDYPMALAIAWQMRKQGVAYKSSGKIVSTSSL